jgi:HlyD family type I secretion membrane fusion protein
LIDSHKEIQHYEGGIIDSILVKDGQYVNKGEVLIELNPSYAQSTASSILTILRSRIATERRILAHINKTPEINFNSHYLDPEDTEVKLIVEAQNQIFHKRENEFQLTIDGQKRDEMRLKQKIAGLTIQLKSILNTQQMKDELLSDIKSLYDRKITGKHSMIQAKKECEDGLKVIAAIESEIEIAKHEMEKAKISANSYQSQYYSNLLAEYEKNHTSYIEIQERYQHALNILHRTKILAPESGIVTGMKHHTVGGIIKSGENIMLIVPQHDNMLIECYLKPQDINNVKVGMPAKIQLDSYKRRLTPRIAGKVVYVSADKVYHNNPRYNEHYLVKVEADKSQINKAINGTSISPGLPATVFLIRGTRTVLSYIAAPLVESLRMSFKEQ